MLIGGYDEWGERRETVLLDVSLVLLEVGERDVEALRCILRRLWHQSIARRSEFISTNMIIWNLGRRGWGTWLWTRAERSSLHSFLPIACSRPIMSRVWLYIIRSVQWISMFSTSMSMISTYRHFQRSQRVGESDKWNSIWCWIFSFSSLTGKL